MNRQELLEQQKKLQKEMDRLKVLIEKEGDVKRWRADKGDVYYTIKGLECVPYSEDYFEIDNDYYISGNYFKTKEEAVACLENKNTKQQLKDLARKLNEGVDIDWNDVGTSKYYISYNYRTKKLENEVSFYIQDIGQVYCYDDHFGDVAIEKIGEDKLIALLKSGV